MGTGRFVSAVATLGLAMLSACSSNDGSPNVRGNALSGTPPDSGGSPGELAPATGGFAPAGAAGLTPSAGGSAQATGGFGPAGTGGIAASAGGFPGTGGTILGAGGAGGGSPAGGANTGGVAEAGGSGGGAPIEKPPCLADPKQIVMIGDSYINWISHTFPTDMNAATSLNIEDFAIGGTSMGSGGIGLIAPQFDTALSTHPNIIAVIMDGGGNDVLVPDTTQFPQGGQCKMMGAQSPSIPDCQKIVDKALDAGTKLFVRLADAGVKDAMFFFYPHVPVNTLVGGTDPNGMLDYALPKIKAACDGAYELSIQTNPAKPIRCHFVDMVPVFDGHPDYFAPTDIHPNPTGSKAMAAAIWAEMKRDCVAQPATSGCCAP